MSNKTKLSIHAFAITILLTFSFVPRVQACSVDNLLLTNDGSLAAVTPQVLNDVLAAIHNDPAKLSDLVKNGTVLELKDGIKVEILERSVEWKMLKIKLPDSNATYWVKDGSLRPLDCNSK